MILWKKVELYATCQLHFMMSKLCDADIRRLWSSFIRGDNESFSEIYKIHIDQLIAYGYKLCTNSDFVHDSIQELFIELFEKREKLEENIINLKAYLFTALRNKIYKKLQSYARQESLDLKESELIFNVEYSHQDKLVRDEISAELKKIIQTATAKLPSKQKEIIYLKFEEEMNYSEISVIMGISVESARKLFYRALLSLRSDIEKNKLQSIFFIIFRKKTEN